MRVAVAAAARDTRFEAEFAVEEIVESGGHRRGFSANRSKNVPRKHFSVGDGVVTATQNRQCYKKKRVKTVR
jgi:hypothetical protein